MDKWDSWWYYPSPVMANEEDQGRGLKSLLRDVPTDYGLTRDESILRRQESILQTLGQGLTVLRDRLPIRGSLRSEVLTPSVVIQPQETRVDLSSVSSRLEPRLREIADEQGRTASGIEQVVHQVTEGLEIDRAALEEAQYQSDQGDVAIGQRRRLLAQGRVALMVSQSLHEEGRKAFVQRMALVEGMAQTRAAIDRVTAQVGEGVDRIDARLLGLQAEGMVSIAELQKHTGILEHIDQLGGLQLTEQRIQSETQIRMAESLANIEATGIAQTELLGAIEQGIGQVRGELHVIGGQIAITNALLEMSVRTLTRIADLTGVIAETGHAIYATLTDIAHSVANPASTNARNVWEIGERCRTLGDAPNAMRKFEDCLQENPTEPRCYYSLGMMALEVEALEAADDFFATGLSYAREEEKGAKDTPLTFSFLLQRGKLSSLAGDYQHAKEYLEEAHKIDRRNMDVWFELAVVEIQMGNRDRAVYYLKNILAITPPKGDDPLMKKIFETPEFKPLLEELSAFDADVLSQMARAAFAEKRYQDARALFESARGAAPASCEVLFELALTEMRLGSTNNAIARLKEMIMLARKAQPCHPCLQLIQYEPDFETILPQLQI